MLTGFQITARVALDDLVQQGFEALVKHKDQHSKIIATPRAELLSQGNSNGL